MLAEGLASWASEAVGAGAVAAAAGVATVRLAGVNSVGTGSAPDVATTVDDEMSSVGRLSVVGAVTAVTTAVGAGSVLAAWVSTPFTVTPVAGGVGAGVLAGATLTSSSSPAATIAAADFTASGIGGSGGRLNAVVTGAAVPAAAETGAMARASFG